MRWGSVVGRSERLRAGAVLRLGKLVFTPRAPKVEHVYWNVVCGTGWCGELDSVG